jgi:AcrR family transcriptional regulator
MTSAGEGSSRAEQRRMTQARILDAAARLFAEAGYERATIRAIAAAAGVDAGLVMHYFGSKESLFRAVMHSAPGAPAGGTPQEATEELLARVAASLTTEPVQSLAVLRSMLTYPEAARAASEESAAYRARLAATIPGPGAELRAAMVTATVLGVIVSRHMLKIEELAEATPEQVIELLGPCLRLLTGADEAEADEAEPAGPAAARD